MTKSTELQALIRQKDGYKVTVKISLCICVVLSWDELEVRQNLLDCDNEIYMVRLLVATVNNNNNNNDDDFIYIASISLIALGD